MKKESVMATCPCCEQEVPTADPENDSLVIEGRSVCNHRICQELGTWYLRKLEENDFTVQSQKLMEALDNAA